VAFYSYGALGTDRYPPFSLGSEPEYPATLEVEYPGELSRGLVLVKWWLLAIPHYLLLGVFTGGGWWAGSRMWDGEGDGWGGGPSLIGLLVLFAAVALLFTTRYPRGIFAFVLGLDRWVARVVAYAGLMTDRYPPFRLDQGGDEPGPPRAAELEPGVAAPPGGAPAATEPRGSRGAGGIVLLVLGSIAALVAFVLLVVGGAGVVLDRTQRDADGFLMSPTESFTTAAYAISSESADVDLDGPDWATEDLLGTVRIRSESERPVFVGIGRDSDVARYLDRVERSVVTEIGRDPSYSQRAGSAPAGRPAGQSFWVASATGAGEQTLEWEPRSGSWSVVLMNADASRGVSADLSIGAELDEIIWVAVGVLVAGALLAALAALAITAGIRSGRRAPG